MHSAFCCIQQHQYREGCKSKIKMLRKKCNSFTKGYFTSKSYHILKIQALSLWDCADLRLSSISYMSWTLKKKRTITDDNKIIDKYKLNEKNLNCLQTNLDTNNNKKIKAINRKENKVTRQYNFIKLKRHRLTTTFWILYVWLIL